MKKKVVAMLMSTLMAFSLAACGSSSGSAGTTDTPAPKTEEAQTTADKTEESAAPDESRPEETVVIRYGTHWVNDLDPNRTGIRFHICLLFMKNVSFYDKYDSILSF